VKVLAIERVTSRGDMGSRQIARFTLELNDDVRLFGLQLLEMPSGRQIISAPRLYGGRAATFSRDLAEAITKLANNELNQMEATRPNEQQYAA
jgi:hypothetical protein